MTFLIGLLMFLGVISSPDQVTTQNYSTYESEYVNEANTDLYLRQMDPTDFEEL